MKKLEAQEIDVCMPTWNSEPVLGETLESLASSLKYANARIDRLIVVDNYSEDGTIAIARSKSEEYGWDILVDQKRASLPKARELAIQKVRTPWFLFLDDDVRLTEKYLKKLLGCLAPCVGAVQGRKLSSSENPWAWTQRRIYRGGTHATLIRLAAVEGIRIPEGVKVLEDEYIRRNVELSGFLWVFHHAARFNHSSMERHPIGWGQGVVAGRYDLMPFHSILMLIGDAVASLRNPFPRLTLMLGWLYGRLWEGRSRW